MIGKDILLVWMYNWQCIFYYCRCSLHDSSISNRRCRVSCNISVGWNTTSGNTIHSKWNNCLLL